MIIKIILTVFCLVFLVGCEDSDYKEIVEPALKKKLADTNPKPIFYGEEEPPIPTKAEIMDDIKGIDRNQNGIRDDIDIWINRTGDNYNEVMALRATARSSQFFLNAAIENRYKDAEKLLNKKLISATCSKVIFSANKSYNYYLDVTYKLEQLLAIPSSRYKKSNSFYKFVILYKSSDYMTHEERYKDCVFELEDRESVMKKYLESINLRGK
jgi:hypothetical protein